VSRQKSRDENIGRLLHAMNDTYGFVNGKVESHKRIIAHILQQTAESGYFIRDYSKNKNICTLSLL
jgi:hypothetical protein